MHKTNLVFIVTIGLAMMGLSLGQARSAVAAPAAHKTSHISSRTHAAPVRSAGKFHKKKSSKLSMNGLASVYADRLNGRKTSSGQKFSQGKMTAAHRSLPLGTRVLVTNLHNNKTVEVCINDRGPYGAGRVIDLSFAAATQLGIKKQGVAQVSLEIVNTEKS